VEPAHLRSPSFFCSKNCTASPNPLYCTNITGDQVACLRCNGPNFLSLLLGVVGRDTVSTSTP
jgi:hypothetical protein